MKKKPKLSEGQNIIRGSVNTAMLLMLLALPVSINILPQDLGFPVLLIILIIIVIMGRPNTDEVTLAEPRWKWMLLRFLVTAAFAVLAWNFESPRLSRRLQTLRGWSHEQQIDEVRTRGA